MSDIRVVLADDHVVLRAGLRALLEAEMGIEVVGEASTGDEAVDLVRELKPTVVVMDLSMPVMDGFTAAEQLKTDTRTRDIPVIALSGHVLPSHTDKARDAGCDTILPKPCLLTDVAAKIRSMLPAAKIPGDK